MGKTFSKLGFAKKAAVADSSVKPDGKNIYVERIKCIQDAQGSSRNSATFARRNSFSPAIEFRHTDLSKEEMIKAFDAMFEDPLKREK